MAKNDDLVTKGFLKKAFDDFRNEIKAMFGEMREENAKVFGEMREENAKVFGKMKNENTEMKDTILGELKSMREDDFAHQFQHQTANDTLDDHETRLRRLEKPRL